MLCLISFQWFHPSSIKLPPKGASDQHYTRLTRHLNCKLLSTTTTTDNLSLRPCSVSLFTLPPAPHPLHSSVSIPLPPFLSLPQSLCLHPLYSIPPLPASVPPPPLPLSLSPSVSPLLSIYSTHHIPHSCHSSSPLSLSLVIYPSLSCSILSLPHHHFHPIALPPLPFLYLSIPSPACI